MAELTLEEARNEEPEKKEVTQEEFDKTFLELLGKCTKTVFLDDHGNDCTIPTNRIELRTSDDKWLFDIQFTGKEHFWFSYEQVLSILKEKYSLQYNEIQRLMKNQVSTRFRIHECTPVFKSDENIAFNPPRQMLVWDIGMDDPLVEYVEEK